MKALEVVDLTMQYLYGATALKNIAFTLEKGEKIAILADCEGGKTSLLKCIAGLYPATSGAIFINEKDITNAKIRDRDILFVYEDGGILKKRSVKFNLEYPLKLRKINRAERNILVHNVAKKYNLEPILTDRGSILYEDDIVKLAFARAELRNASVLLIDDIFKILPYNLREKMFEDMSKVIKSINTAVVFATNSVDDAFTLCDRALVLTFGKMEQIGSRDELTSKPHSLNVDKIVNLYKNRMVATVEKDDNGNFVKILDKNYYVAVNDEYIGKEVFASFYLEKQEYGFKSEVVSHIYRKGQLFAVFANDLSLKTGDDNIAESYLVGVNVASLNIYDYATEKLLTY